jgi:hypothetical protein
VSARWHEEVTPGSGLRTEVKDALCAMLRCVVPAMFKAQEPWALIGSTASVLQGIEGYSPPDIDLATTTQGAYIMSGCAATLGATVRPVAFSTAGPYTSHFGIFEVMGVKVEVMGDLVIRCPDGKIDLHDHWSRWSDKVRVLHFEGLHIPVVPLEWQMVANALLNRPERVGGVAHHMLEHGFDRPYLEEILADYQYGERTIAWVRKELHIEQ